MAHENLAAPKVKYHLLKSDPSYCVTPVIAAWLSRDLETAFPTIASCPLD